MIWVHLEKKVSIPILFNLRKTSVLIYNIIQALNLCIEEPGINVIKKANKKSLLQDWKELDNLSKTPYLTH